MNGAKSIADTRKKLREAAMNKSEQMWAKYFMDVAGVELHLVGDNWLSGTYLGIQLSVRLDPKTKSMEWEATHPISHVRKTGVGDAKHADREIRKLVMACDEMLGIDKSTGKRKKKRANELVVEEVMGWLVKRNGGSFEISSPADTQEWEGEERGDVVYEWYKDTGNDRRSMYSLSVLVCYDGINVVVSLATDKVSDRSGPIPAAGLKAYVTEWNGW